MGISMLTSNSHITHSVTWLLGSSKQHQRVSKAYSCTVCQKSDYTVAAASKVTTDRGVEKEDGVVHYHDFSGS